MPVQLTIRDGNPWYFSPDIWVVSGNDPNGQPGNPVAGTPAYLWAHISNTGDTDANNVRLDFYWANPALQVTRSNATLIGSSFTDVAAGGSQDVLLLTPWVPVVVNGGHECLVVVANHPSDPLPNPLPDAFDPPTYRQVAQRNLTVMDASPHMMSLIITINGSRRKQKDVTITAETGGKIDEITMKRLGINAKDLAPAKKKRVQLHLSHEAVAFENRKKEQENKLSLKVPAGRSKALYLSIHKNDLEPHEYELVHIVEREGDKVLGGIGFIILHSSK